MAAGEPDGRAGLMAPSTAFLKWTTLSCLRLTKEYEASLSFGAPLVARLASHRLALRPISNDTLYDRPFWDVFRTHP